MKAKMSMIGFGGPPEEWSRGAWLTAQVTTIAVIVRTQTWVYAFGLRSDRV